VRGMCFMCVDNLDNMTVKQIKSLRKCPNLIYSIAWKLFNNEGVSEVRMDDFSPTLHQFLEKNPSITEILLPTEQMMEDVRGTIYEFECDDDDDDDSVCLRVEHEYNENECSENCPHKN